MVEKQRPKSPKVLRSDSGGEYLSIEMRKYLEVCVLEHRLCAPENVFQKDVAKRMNWSLVKHVRAMVYHKNVQKRFWAGA